MTLHALQRIAERLSGSNPQATLAEIKRAVTVSRRQRYETLRGDAICEVLLETGQTVFPVVATDGNILTVLTEHMNATTSSGRVTLCTSDPLDDCILGAGLHDIPAAVYHADPAPRPSLSSSIARKMLKQSPRHGWTASPQLNPYWEPVEKKTFDIGRAAHRAVLGKGGDYAAIPEAMLAKNGAASTAAAKEFIEYSRANGITPLKADEVRAIETMAAVCRARLADFGIELDPARSELTAIAELDGIWCRAMVDNAPEAPIVIPGVGPRMVIIDFKTTEDASPDACRRSVENYWYDLQQAHYRDTWRAATGEDRDFIFVFQEKEPPFEVGVVRLLNSPGHSADWSEDAAEKARYARQLWGRCLAEGTWPGYPPLLIEVGAAAYHRQKWQDTVARAASAKAADRQTLARAAEWQSPTALAGE